MQVCNPEDYPQHIRHCVWRELINCLCVEDCGRLFTVHKPWEPYVKKSHVPWVAQVSTKIPRSRPGGSINSGDDATLGGCGPETQTQKLFIDLRITAGGCDEGFTPWDANVFVGQVENEIMRVICACATTTRYMSAVELVQADYQDRAYKDPSSDAIMFTADLVLSVSYTCRWC